MRVLIPTAALLVGASAFSGNTIVKRDGGSNSTFVSGSNSTSGSGSGSGSGSTSVSSGSPSSPSPQTSNSGSPSPPPFTSSPSGGTNDGGSPPPPPPVFNSDLDDIFKRLFAGNSTFSPDSMKGKQYRSDRPRISFSSPLKIKGNRTSETALFILRDCGQGGLSICADDASAGANFFSKVDLRVAGNLTTPPIPSKDFAKFLSEKFNRPLVNMTDGQAAIAEVSFLRALLQSNRTRDSQSPVDPDVARKYGDATILSKDNFRGNFTHDLIATRQNDTDPTQPKNRCAHRVRKFPRFSIGHTYVVAGNNGTTQDFHKHNWKLLSLVEVGASMNRYNSTNRAYLLDRPNHGTWSDLSTVSLSLTDGNGITRNVSSTSSTWVSSRTPGFSVSVSWIVSPVFMPKVFNGLDTFDLSPCAAKSTINISGFPYTLPDGKVQLISSLASDKFLFFQNSLLPDGTGNAVNSTVSIGDAAALTFSSKVRLGADARSNGTVTMEASTIEIASRTTSYDMEDQSRTVEQMNGAIDPVSGISAGEVLVDMEVTSKFTDTILAFTFQTPLAPFLSWDPSSAMNSNNLDSSAQQQASVQSAYATTSSATLSRQVKSLTLVASFVSAIFYLL